MQINTVCLDLDRYHQLLEAERLGKELAKLLEATAEPLAEYRSICEYFGDKPWEREYYEEWLSKHNEPEPKPSQDCLTAMAKLNWRDCCKAVDTE